MQPKFQFVKYNGDATPVIQLSQTQFKELENNPFVEKGIKLKDLEPTNPINDRLVNPDYFEHPDGTRLYWKGADDGTGISNGRDVVRWEKENSISMRENGIPCGIDYVNNKLYWSLDGNSYKAIYRNDSREILFYNDQTPVTY